MINRVYIQFGRVSAVLLALVFSLSAQALTDPTAPFDAPKTVGGEASSSWVLESVIISESRKIAVINGELYRVSDQVAGAKIVSISSKKVTLRKGGETIVLTLHDSIRQ